MYHHCRRSFASLPILGGLLMLFVSPNLLAQSISFSPNNGERGSSFGITVTGSGTGFTVSSTTCVQVFTTPTTLQLSNVSVQSSTMLTGNLSVPITTASGTYDARVYSGPGCSGAQYNCMDCFTVNPCDTTIMEDFQSQIIAVDWQNLDLDMNVDANGRPVNWYTIMDSETTSPGDTNYVVASSSWFSPADQADNWLIVGPICITSSEFSAFWRSAPFEGPGFADGYKVKISTTGSDIANFTNTLASFAEDVGGGAGTWGPGIQHPTFNGNRGVLAPWEFSLSAYVGEVIYLAFHHDSNDDNLIMIDDIKIAESIEDAALVDAIAPSEYTIIPLYQIRGCPIDLGCTVRNVGGQTITNVFSTCTIYRDHPSNVLSTFVSNTLVQMLANDEQELVFTGDFAPLSEGSYTLEYIVKTDQDDPTTSGNDTIRKSFVVADTTMARDDGIITSSLSIGDGADGLIGQHFTLKHPDTIYALDFFLSSPTVGDTVKAVLYTADSPTGQPQNLITETPDRIITLDDSTNAKVIRIQFPTPIAMPVGTFWAGLKESRTGSLTLASTTNIHTPSTAWVFFNNAWGTSEFFGFPVSYVLRPIFATCKDSIYLNGTIPGYESDITYRAGWSIRSIDEIKSGATSIYYDSGGDIDLLPGFSIENGVTWQTMNNGCAEPMFLNLNHRSKRTANNFEFGGLQHGVLNKINSSRPKSPKPKMRSQ